MRYGDARHLNEITYALTLYPEWIPVFQYLGKRVENRPWAPPPAVIGTRIALHAGTQIGGGNVGRGMRWLNGAGTVAGFVFSLRRYDPRNRARLAIPELHWSAPDGQNSGAALVHMGCVLGSARVLAASRTEGFGCPWAMPDQVHWHLGDFVWLRRPVTMTGRQKLWRLAK